MFYLIQNMPRIIDDSPAVNTSGATDDLLSRNWQTTTAVAVGVATGGLFTGVMLTAAPAQTLASGAAIGSLAYVGHRRFTNGNVPIGECLPKFGKQEPVNITAQVDPVPA